MPQQNVTIKFPIEIADKTGFMEIPYSDPTEAVKFHLKNILLTNPTENLSDPEFGVGLKSYIFEMETSEKVVNLQSIIVNQIKKYANYFSKLNVIVDTSGLYANSLTVRIEFEYGIKKLKDSIEVTVSI